MVLALLLTVTNPVTKHFPDQRSRRRYYTLRLITALSAVFEPCRESTQTVNLARSDR